MHVKFGSHCSLSLSFLCRSWYAKALRLGGSLSRTLISDGAAVRLLLFRFMVSDGVELGCALLFSEYPRRAVQVMVPGCMSSIPISRFLRCFVTMGLVSSLSHSPTSIPSSILPTPSSILRPPLSSSPSPIHSP